MFYVAIPNAQIFSFGYDADVVNLRHPVSTETIAQHANNLINKLERERRHAGEVRALLYGISYANSYSVLVGSFSLRKV